MNSEEGETLSTIPTNTTTTRKRSIRSHCLIYIKNIQQANERTAAEYQYRLFRFEKYIIAPEQQQNQAPRITRSSLDQVIEELKRIWSEQKRMKLQRLLIR